MHQAFLRVVKEEDEAPVTHVPQTRPTCARVRYMRLMQKKKNGFAYSPVRTLVVPVSVRDLSNRPLACVSAI